MKYNLVSGTAALLFLTSALLAQSTAMHYQGRLTAGGSPAEGLYDLQFTLFDAETDGNPIGEPVFLSPVAVSNGLFQEQDGNRARGDWSSVGGGRVNRADGEFSTVAGGELNLADGRYAVVPGGLANFASGDFSFAAGENAHAAHDGAFVWADGSFGGVLESTTTNQFLVRASGGVLFYTNPEATVGAELASLARKLDALQSLVESHLQHPDQAADSTAP